MARDARNRARIHVFYIRETGRTRAFPPTDGELRIYLVSSAVGPRVPLFGGHRPFARRTAYGEPVDAVPRQPVRA